MKENRWWGKDGTFWLDAVTSKNINHTKNKYYYYYRNVDLLSCGGDNNELALEETNKMESFFYKKQKNF